MKFSLFTGLICLSCIMIFPQQVKSMSTLEIPLIEGTPSAASYNSEAWEQTMIKAKNISGLKMITIPQGNYYFNQTLSVPSKITLTGTSSDTTKLIFTRLVTGLKIEENQTLPESSLQAEDITIQNLNISYLPNLSGSSFVSLLEVSPKFEEENRLKYEVYRNITIQNNKFDMREKGSTIVAIGRVQHLLIKNNELKNSGLQNGISLEFTDDAIISDNSIQNVGRSGIQLYRFNGDLQSNNKIMIKNNTIKDWMQRFGKYHFEKNMEAGITPDIMADAGIDSYGPYNQNIYIQNNNLQAGQVGENISDNLFLREKYGDQVYPQNAVLYTGIRLSGSKNSFVFDNTVQLKGEDVFSWFTSNSRSRGLFTTYPGDILVKKNLFKLDGSMVYPIRLFHGQVINDRGFDFEDNQFYMSETSHIKNYYKTFIEVRMPSDMVNLANNQMIDPGRKLYFILSANAPLKQLMLKQNLLNNNSWATTRGEIEKISIMK
ncbi:hypothetical protein X560_0003 [Listeria fleischmannii 1991]|uniref:Right handed beta helix domain-containing protein n=1 Tax=Listeria fleischmannii 1991 TaxID=1430899 RepID=A0A0J8GKY5_9LIST|nr:NosD domain-containing protein [Listeria fleischmannii]KMT61423.1 hypothetical protein X560_0003 [Listeria fleischmannii 1991]